MVIEHSPRSLDAASTAMFCYVHASFTSQSFTGHLIALDMLRCGCSTGMPQPPQVRPPPPTHVAPKAPSGLDSDFVALQRIFEEMLAKEDPPSIAEFEERTRFIEAKSGQSAAGGSNAR